MKINNVPTVSNIRVGLSRLQKIYYNSLIENTQYGIARYQSGATWHDMLYLSEFTIDSTLGTLDYLVRVRKGGVGNGGTNYSSFYIYRIDTNDTTSIPSNNDNRWNIAQSITVPFSDLKTYYISKSGTINNYSGWWKLALGTGGSDYIIFNVDEYGFISSDLTSTSDSLNLDIVNTPI